jgi:hypothetical protein
LRALPSNRFETLKLRVDHDVVDFFRAGGPGWQTCMNAVLRAATPGRQPQGGAAARMTEVDWLERSSKQMALSSPSGQLLRAWPFLNLLWRRARSEIAEPGPAECAAPVATAVFEKLSVENTFV